MTRLLVALSPEEVDAIDGLMADLDLVAGIGRQRARAIGPLLLRAIELATANERLAEELERMRQAEQVLRANLSTERRTRADADASRDRSLKALKAERNEHARTRRRLRNARATARRLRAFCDAMRGEPAIVVGMDHGATD